MAILERTRSSGVATSAPIEILLANHRRLLAFVERRVESRAVAEEVLQDAFVRSVERIGDLRDEEKALPWFYQLLRNAIAGHWRRRGSEQRALEAIEREPTDEAEAGEALEAVVCACLHDLLGNLREDYADLLRQVDLGEASIASYAESAGLTANNVRVRLHRSRAALRRELEKTCRTCAEHGCLDCHCGTPRPA